MYNISPLLNYPIGLRRLQYIFLLVCVKWECEEALSFLPFIFLIGNVKHVCSRPMFELLVKRTSSIFIYIQVSDFKQHLYGHAFRMIFNSPFFAFKETATWDFARFTRPTYTDSNNSSHSCFICLKCRHHTVLNCNWEIVMFALLLVSLK